MRLAENSGDEPHPSGRKMVLTFRENANKLVEGQYAAVFPSEFFVDLLELLKSMNASQGNELHI